MKYMGYPLSKYQQYFLASAVCKRQIKVIIQNRLVFSLLIFPSFPSDAVGNSFRSVCVSAAVTLCVHRRRSMRINVCTGWRSRDDRLDDDSSCHRDGSCSVESLSHYESFVA